MIESLLKFKLPRILTPEEKDRLRETIEKLYQQYPSGTDAWGLNLERAGKSLQALYPVYKHYFSTRVFGKENVPDGPCFVVSNHSGQIAIDGMLIGMAFALELEKPKILRAMVERFFIGLPFINQIASEGGAVLGDRQNCLSLLERGQSVLAFPEGVSGVAKSTSEFYHLQRFTRGFYRMALQANVPIVPVAVVGAEEFFPYVFQAKRLAKLIGMPAFPLSLNYFPLPSPVDIHILPPIHPKAELGPDAVDSVIDEEVVALRKLIQEKINTELPSRRKFVFNAKKRSGHAS